MKIYPGNHEIVSSEEVTVNHIPLGYFVERDSKVIPEITISEEIASKVKDEIVYPYQIFDNEDILFFDKNGAVIKESKGYLKRYGNSYVFNPKDSVEFIPTNFSFKLLMEKSDTFKHEINYDIKIGALNMEIAEKILGIFSDSNKNIPKNIKFNSGSSSIYSLFNMKMEDADFVFINASEHEKIEELLKNHVNVWVVADEFENIMHEDESIEEYILSSPQIYKSGKYALKGYKRIKFDTEAEWEYAPKSEFEYINLFQNHIPISIAKKEDEGFLILSHSSILDAGESCYPLIFEIISAIFLNSYFETKNRNLDIADNIIDYFVKVYKRFNQYHPNMNLKKILYEDKKNVKINAEIIDVIVNDEKVKFTGTNSNGDLFFRKKENSDPEKSSNAISVYTNNHSIINYDFEKNVIRNIEDDLVIIFKRISDKNYLIIEPYRSTIKAINLTLRQVIEIPDSSRYILCFDDLKSEFRLIKENIYTESEYGELFADIHLKYNTKLSCADIRNVGGGECSIINYDMLDSGSLKGRPYRLGSTMIIKLPKRFKDQRENILSEIKKHMSSADYPVLMFE